MQAAILLFKMACYTVGPLLVLDLVFSMGQPVLMWGDQAGLELWVVDSRIWKLFPVSLMLAASCALLIEVGLTPFTACMLVYPAYWCTGCHTSTKCAKA